MEGEKAVIEVFVDSDWAKGPARRSTSGGLVKVGGSVAKHWNRVQGARALSTAEAEYYAIAGGCAEAHGVSSLMTDLGVPSKKILVWTSSSAAKGMVGRRGLGKRGTWS